MSIDEKDIQALEHRFDLKYVSKKDCDKKTEETERKIAECFTKMAVIETYQKVQLWILTATGGGVIAMLIKMFFGGV